MFSLSTAIEHWLDNHVQATIRGVESVSVFHCSNGVVWPLASTVGKGGQAAHSPVCNQLFRAIHVDEST